MFIFIILCSIPISAAWNPIHCQHIECQNSINKPAVKVETALLMLMSIEYVWIYIYLFPSSVFSTI